MTSGKPSLAFRIGFVLGALGLIGWVAYWYVTLENSAIPLGKKMWITFPMYGADFWSQSGMAAKLWLDGLDPYAMRGHVLPYPPLVIRLFLWAGYFSDDAGIRIWTLTLASIAIAAAVVAHRTRQSLGLLTPPITLSVFVVLASYPLIFEMERANCNLITVLTILLALPLLRRGDRYTELAAGLLLSVGPWVKFYPGLMGLGLLALRRWWAAVGFALGGAAIFLAMPDETFRAFKVLRALMTLTQYHIMSDPVWYPPWTHSLSHAWLLFAREMTRIHSMPIFSKIPAVAVATSVALAIVAPVCIRVFKFRDRASLTYPVLLWVCAVASTVPVIANDYSLVFFPLCVIACVDPRDSWLSRIFVAVSLLTWQPFLLPVSGWTALTAKVLGLLGCGVSLWQRARPHAATVEATERGVLTAGAALERA